MSTTIMATPLHAGIVSIKPSPQTLIMETEKQLKHPQRYFFQIGWASAICAAQVFGPLADPNLPDGKLFGRGIGLGECELVDH